MINAHAQTTYN